MQELSKTRNSAVKKHVIDLNCLHTELINDLSAISETYTYMYPYDGCQHRQTRIDSVTEWNHVILLESDSKISSWHTRSIN
jgi:hypothetical protein